MRLKKIITITLIAALTLAVGCGANTEELKNEQTKQEGNIEEVAVPDNAVARVNNVFISNDIYEKNNSLIKRIYDQEYGPEIWEKDYNGRTVGSLAKEQNLDKLIRVVVIKEYISEKFDFVISEEEATKAFDNFKTEYQGNEEMKSFYEENNISDDFIKEQINDGLYLQKFYEVIKAEVEADAEFLEEKYANQIIKVKASHILVDDLKTAEEIIEKLNNDGDFAELATEYSKDPGSGSNGGELGYFEKGKMVPEFEKAAFELDIDKVSEPIQTQFGYHIIKAADKKTVNDLIEDEEKEEIIEKYKEQIINESLELVYDTKITELVSNANIEMYIEFITDKKEEQ